MGRSVMGRDNGEAVNVMVLVGKCAGYQTNDSVSYIVHFLRMNRGRLYV